MFIRNMTSSQKYRAFHCLQHKETASGKGSVRMCVLYSSYRSVVPGRVRSTAWSLAVLCD
jgi:hypothetical protein